LGTLQLKSKTKVTKYLIITTNADIKQENKSGSYFPNALLPLSTKASNSRF
jgi:hypothetical protein